MKKQKDRIISNIRERIKISKNKTEIIHNPTKEEHENTKNKYQVDKVK